jgi:hypothetical protein
MAKGSKAKASEPAREGNRYTRASRVLAKDDTIDAKTHADRAYMSESKTSCPRGPTVLARLPAAPPV